MRPALDEAEAAYRRPAPAIDTLDLFAAPAEDAAVEAVRQRVGMTLDPILSAALRDAALAKHELHRADRIAWLRDRLEALARARQAAGQPPTVTGDDAWALWQAHPEATADGPVAWFGSVFRCPRFAWTGRLVKSARPSNKASDLRVWVLTGGME